jgi:hypothetical protein
VIFYTFIYAFIFFHSRESFPPGRFSQHLVSKTQPQSLQPVSTAIQTTNVTMDESEFSMEENQVYYDCEEEIYYDCEEEIYYDCEEEAAPSPAKDWAISVRYTNMAVDKI